MFRRLVLLALLILFTSASDVPAQSVSLNLAGNGLITIPSSAWGCPSLDPDRKVVADGPAFVFRDSRGLIHLFTAYWMNYAFVGSGLSNLKQVCVPTYRSHSDPTAQNFAFHEWLISGFALDDNRVYGMIHDESYPMGIDKGPVSTYMAITQAMSTDGGNTFTRIGGRDGLVATDPHPNVPGGFKGLGDPSNVIKNPKDGYYYFAALNHSLAEPGKGSGSCILRSSDLRSWSAWDGTGFNLNNSNATSGYKCAMVINEDTFGTIRSLVYVPAAKQFLAVGSTAHNKVIFYATSFDLVHWSKMTFLRVPPQVEGMRLTWAYPSLIDGDSPDRNFTIVRPGDHIYLYLTAGERNAKTGKPGFLVRFPVSLTVR
jgi:hypothetical protein